MLNNDKQMSASAAVTYTIMIQSCYCSTSEGHIQILKFFIIVGFVSANKQMLAFSIPFYSMPITNQPTPRFWTRGKETGVLRENSYSTN